MKRMRVVRAVVLALSFNVSTWNPAVEASSSAASRRRTRGEGLDNKTPHVRGQDHQPQRLPSASLPSRRTLKAEKEAKHVMEKLVKKGRSDSTWEGCTGVMEFDEILKDDFVEGDLSQFGERSLWSNRPVFDMDGDIVGSVAGMCTVVGEASTSGEGGTTHFCTSHYQWTSGDFESSTLVAEGPKLGTGETAYSFTILGGSGCFAGASGTVRGQSVPATNTVRTSIQLE